MIVLDIATLLFLAALFGGMLAFSVLFAPLVFIKLEAATAGGFIRQVFPWYYLYVLVTGGLSALGLAVTGAPLWAIATAAVVALLAVYTRWVLMAQINALRDRELAGDEEAGKAFQARHRLSVWINGAQLIAAAVLLAATAG